jgi:hypothetical protein
MGSSPRALGASFLADSLTRGSPDFGFAATPASIYGAGLVVGAVVDPVVA